jgi:IS30 family transposase
MNETGGSPLRYVPAPLRNTVIYDRGKEMVEHERLAERLALQVFFAYGQL